MTEQEVLRIVREIAGEEKFREALEDLRQAGIWGQVQVVRQQKELPITHVVEALQAITDKWPKSVREWIMYYVTLRQDAFLKSQKHKKYTDGTGEQFLKSCLMTFGGKYDG